MLASAKSCLLAATALSWAGLSSAHLIMKTPVPFGVDTLNNSPLVDVAIGSATSDFPCKQRTGVYKVSQMNNMAVGQSQTLSFTGSASHGGGTCQLAVSMDLEPTANSTWKIIQVYEGGCPITADGNAGTDDFTFSIPQGFPNGQSTLAWTWYNRVGNREIYMNCAPITVTGGSDDKTFYDSLSDMYVINLPSSECSTVETTNQVIPNPGQFILKGDSADKAADATGPACAAAAAAQTQGVQGYQSATATDGATVETGSAAVSGSATAAATTIANNGFYTQASATAAPTEPADSSSAAISSALAVTVPSGLVTMPISLIVTAPATSSTVLAAPAASSAVAAPSSPASAPGATSGNSTTNGSGASPGASSGSSSGTSASGSGTCSVDGAVVCNGPNQFGLCNFGSVVWQDVAAGTTCSNGVISKRANIDVNVDGAVAPVKGGMPRFKGYKGYKGFIPTA